MTLGNGLSVANDWGNDGRLASRRLYNTSAGTNLSWLGYSQDANDNLGSIRDLTDETKSVYYGFDANDRMSLVSQAVATVPNNETYVYSAGTNRLASLTTSAGARTVTYDGRGNTSSESRPGSVTVSTSYDGYGRLLSYNRTGDPAQANAYNGLDDRVRATSGTTAHRFVFDADGRVLGEYGASATAVLGETIWLSPRLAANDNQFGGGDGVGGYAPLAVGTGSGTGAALTWIHGNHLGVPLVFSNASGAAVAAPNYTLPGFPGQLKTLSDIYYNRYRDYDSSTGRYIQADPAGLEGGANSYSYADDNPLAAIDSDGLSIRIITKNRKDYKTIGDAYYRLLTGSKHARTYINLLEKSCIEYRIVPIYRDAFYCSPGATRNRKSACYGTTPYTIYVDPNNLIKLITNQGLVATPLEVVIGHELGHAAGTPDEGPGVGKDKMNNVWKNENPIRIDLGLPVRTKYPVPAPMIWISK